MKLNKVLITGATGFVGQNLSINLESKYNIKKWGRPQLQHCNINELNDVDAVIHLAGKAHDLKKVTNPDEYYQANYELTKQLFDAFLESSATVFVFMSSVKAAADEVTGFLTENCITYPNTHFGLSKRQAEEYIVSKKWAEGKRVYILRPCMIHGPGNKGNLNLLYKLVSKGIPWPLGDFENQRSFCSIKNLMFVIEEIIEREEIESGIYNVADNEAISTNEVISIIAESFNKKPLILNVSRQIVRLVVKLLDYLHIINASEKLKKLTESYIVSNQKLSKVIGKPFPVDARHGLLTTFQFFKNNCI